jgi:hypothetical protein
MANRRAKEERVADRSFVYFADRLIFAPQSGQDLENGSSLLKNRRESMVKSMLPRFV